MHKLDPIWLPDKVYIENRPNKSPDPLAQPQRAYVNVDIGGISVNRSELLEEAVL